MKMFKGFTKDMKCRDFQYEIGKSYQEDKADLYQAGFHACEYPLDCLNYYSPNDSVYHEVELDDLSPETSEDSKRVGKRITIGARLNIKGLVDASIQFIKEHIDKTKGQTVIGNNASNTGDYSAASNTGYRSAASNTGDYSAASNTGDYSAASNTGDYSAASNTGYRSAAEVSGCQSVAMAIGNHSKARGALGCWIVLADWKNDENNQWFIADVKCVKVDGNAIKPDVWYQLSDGKFKEVDQ